MTRAEYQQKYGTAPQVSSTPAPVQMTHAEYMAKYGPPTTPPAPPAGLLGHLTNASKAITDFLGMHDAVDTVGSNLATIAHPKLAEEGLIDQPSLMDNVKAGISIGINTAGVETAPKIAGEVGAIAARQVAAKTATKTLETVAPKLTARETADALAKYGGAKTGLLGKIQVNLPPSVSKLADAVSTHVPDFNPGKSLVENINVTRDAAYHLADQLKQTVVATGKDVIYPFKELSAQLKAIETPAALTRDLEPVYQRVQNKMLEIVRANGGKLSDLLESRKEFDQYVSKALPNLYDKEFTPMRLAVTDMRRAVNDFIAEHLPKDIGFHDSLTNQSRLFQAIDNMAEKAASGAQKEVGTNALDRAGQFIKKHPVGSAIGATAAYEEAKKLLPFLP